jgi:16S rRNA (guanine527-N7)-methyltransferase
VSSEQEIFKRGITELGVSASDTCVASLFQYLDILEETNRTFNLTRIPRSEYVTLHLLDSLTCILEIESRAGLRILDVGTGAGFPGVPLAALRPEASVTLLDSTSKKIRFVTETANTCGITNIIGIHGRAELIAKTPEHRNAYDMVVSRAVAAYPKLMEWLLPLTKRGGRVLAMKGSGYQDEMKGTEKLLERLGGTVEKIRTVMLPGTDIERSIIVVKKI